MATGVLGDDGTVAARSRINQRGEFRLRFGNSAFTDDASAELVCRLTN
jgi:hypothetical protein